MYKNNNFSLFCFLFLILIFSGCSTTGIKVTEPEEIEAETTQLQESNLLDVGILLFEEGEITEKQKKKEGAHEDIRDAESRFMAYHLKETLQHSNGWGAIRVLPEKSYIADVVVSGTILTSNGEEMILKINVIDSTGQEWYEKTYKTYADDESYRNTKPGRDVYQYVYNRIANDVRKHRNKLTEENLIAIRNTSEIRYAAGISPDPFADYIDSGPNGQSLITRLPANDDPMLDRVRKVRDREFLFIDTINEHYSNFYGEMWEPYENWRKYYLIEAEQRRAVERRAKQTKFVAALIMVAGVMRGPGLFTTGALLYKNGMDISEEAEIHNEAIRELGDSLQAEVSPMVVEIEGRTVELTGSIEEQYQKWRELLREIYINETGFAFDDNAIETDSAQL
ncbi:MAG: hypothetical protein KJO81_10945 [Gammaproteobacteria bacterium]|nr:hypothetical protein [Gammaproteobacteria bacterium]MBT8125332.1 hypothetical protein [Gammaproteobacteria bacterium]NNC66982.1 hypothetical protein [Gammaproteobacteria bacterium]